MIATSLPYYNDLIYFIIYDLELGKYESAIIANNDIAFPPP